MEGITCGILNDEEGAENIALTMWVDNAPALTKHMTSNEARLLGQQLLNFADFLEASVD